MPVLISRRGVASTPIGTAALRRRAELMLRAVALPAAELSILICDDATIHVLNRSHRRRDRPTDVLAFALREGRPLAVGPGAHELLGDVVISLETARRQARARRRTLWDEVTTLLAHGLLHLIGYDHRTSAEERRMNARADLLVAAAVRRRPQRPSGPVDKRAQAGDLAGSSRPRRGPSSRAVRK